MPSQPPLGSTSSPFLPRHHRAYMRPTPTGVEDQYHIDFINPLFQTASHIVQTRLPASGPIQPTYKEKLLLYSFFKQAVNGDVQQISPRPGVFDMLGRAKWDAWKKLEGLQPVDAKKLYVDTLLKMLKKHAETPEARTLIEGLEGFTPSVARSDLTSTPSGSSSTLVRPTQHEDEPETGEEDLVTSDSEKDSSFQDNDEAPSSLGPYVTRAQLPDPVNMSQADPVVAETYPSKANQTRDSRIIPHHQLRMSDRPASRAPTELSVGSRDRALPDDTRSPANNRRLSAIQLAALISRPRRFDELDSLRSRGRPISRPPSAVTNDVMSSALDEIAEQDRSEHVTVAADAYLFRGPEGETLYRKLIAYKDLSQNYKLDLIS
ncbi:hypothetical protein CROQUDRAFT_588603 [Cronartium quercuum f. sp. fusiforme G11]|uniref:ACB domain-containing protein n=1 Tax=Cronartium quercuum f. sp. fusiforme G11 TaxID=708437 RepID=A0A9P6NFK2_9BASI|nr:hypothetical protein CROQUDRAFT_588603 [Cronartium quercuum f. sp. fusiforme G11]